MISTNPNSFSIENIRKKTIDKWILQQRIEQEIEEQAPKAKLKHELSVQDELMQLHLFELENFYITKHLDSSITKEEIQDYYKSHRDSYKKESYIVKALYIKVPDTLASILKLDNYYLLKNEKDLQEVNKIANLYATNFYYEEDRWIYFEDLVREISISSNKKEEIVKNRGNAIFRENGET